jgi:hypothetical protein
LDDLITKQLNEILMSIGGHFTQVVKPLRRNWDGGSSSPGAPAKIETDATYLTETPPQTVNLPLTDVLTVYNPEISYRRWIAQRIARYLLSKNSLFIPDTKSNDKYLPDKSLWTRGAIVAYAGLNRELLELTYKHNDVPGFCGPDEWYL